jgi:GH25 family lysozyme M1 (1,4-beta-N-acetylmuramidase)
VNKDEVNFVIIRAGYGFRSVDPTFIRNIEGAISAGLDIGIYWFSYAHTADDARIEAESCLSAIEPYRQHITFPVWFDWEYESDNYVRKQYGVVLSKQQVSAIAKCFMQTIAKSGFKTGYYANPDYLYRYFTDEVKANYDLWLAHVANGKGEPLEHSTYKGSYTIHQYSWVGKPQGFSTNTDMNYCFFDYTGNYNPEKNLPPHYEVPEGIKFHTPVSKNVITKYLYNFKKDLFLSDHFQVKEFASFKSKTELYTNDVFIHNKLIIILEALYKKLNCSKIIVNSGYRTEEHDKVVGGDGKGYHTLGRAADITCYNKSGRIIDAKTVCMTLENMGGIYGIGYISPTSVHVDTRPKDRKWFGDERIYGAPSISKLGYATFEDYFEKNK